MKKTIMIPGILIAALSVPHPSWSQEPGRVVLDTRIQKEIVTVNDEGEKETRLVEAGNAVPGDELIITVSYTNAGTEPAENVVIVNPVPEHTSYLGNTARGAGTRITFSVDGGVSWDTPANLKVAKEDGKPRTALPGEYTHIRWVREGHLPPGGEGRVLFRVRLR